MSHRHTAETSKFKTKHGTAQLHHISFPVFTTSIFFILLILKLVKTSKRRSANLPPQPWTLPLIGNLHQLASSAPHRALRDLAKKYGPLMHLQLGEVSTMVVSSSDVAKEVMKTHDIIFASRPHIIATRILSYDSKNMAFAPYGDYWRQLRKICALELLSAKRVLSFKPIRDEEMGKLIRFISSRAGKSTDLSERTSLMIFDIITKAVFGKSTKDAQLFISLLSKIVKLASGFSVGDIFPSRPFLHVISGVKPKLEALRKDMDKILESIISEDEVTQGLLHALKTLQRDPEHYMTSDHVKAVLLDILIGGSETSATIIHWAMAELMKNPKVLGKVQAEVRQMFDQQGLVDESQIHKLKYLNLVIKEVLRLHPPAPLLLPRFNSENCVINGYEIPAKTKFIINAWAIGRDPKYWDDPEVFQPERFVNSSVEFMGSDFEYIPFGAGRRMCPGITLGSTIVEYFLANMLFHFNWKLPNGMQPNELDMTESFGVSMARKEDLLLVPIPYERSSMAN
ncbi:unnamed protein product [Rhodiola kirilowii]